MKTPSKGFTLIELVVVIVILGILAATALPRFVNLSAEADAAAAAGVAGAIGSSASIQFAAFQLSAGRGYSTTAACNGTYLQTGVPNTCGAPALVGQQCTVTCGTGTSAVTLP